MEAVLASEREDLQSHTSRSSLFESVGCALRVKLQIDSCVLPEDAHQIALKHGSKCISLRAAAGMDVTFHIIAPLPSAAEPTSEPITFELQDEDNRSLFRTKITIGTLLNRKGLEMANFFREEGLLSCRTFVTVLHDPVLELPRDKSSIIELVDYFSPEICLGDECKRLRYCALEQFAVPPVHQLCTIKEARAAPIVTRIGSPRALWTWTTKRPEELDEDYEGEYIDLGDGVFAPKKNIERLRLTFGTQEEKCRIPAGHGKMSLLQACVMKPVEQAPSVVIPLGPPISLRGSPVLLTTHLLKQSEKYIEDVDVSDSEDEKDKDEDFEAAIAMRSTEILEENNTDVAASSKKSSESGIADTPSVAKVPSMREKIQAMMQSNDNEAEIAVVQKLSSMRSRVQSLVEVEESSSTELFARQSSSKFGVSESDDDAELMSRNSSRKKLDLCPDTRKRLDDAERECTFLRRELESVQGERDRLIEQLRAQSLANRCVTLEAELRALREVSAKAKRENDRLQQRVKSLETGKKIEEKQGNELRKQMSKKEINMQSEYDRLLEVIANLNEELSRQPDQETILAELLEAKQALVLEKVEKEELARELTVLKTTTSVVVSPTRISDSEQPLEE